MYANNLHTIVYDKKKKNDILFIYNRNETTIYKTQEKYCLERFAVVTQCKGMFRPLTRHKIIKKHKILKFSEISKKKQKI